jgi:hypothetical protein
LDIQSYDASWIRFNTKQHTTFYMPTQFTAIPSSSSTRHKITPTTSNAAVCSQFNNDNKENTTSSFTEFNTLCATSITSTLPSNPTYIPTNPTVTLVPEPTVENSQFKNQLQERTITDNSVPINAPSMPTTSFISTESSEVNSQLNNQTREETTDDSNTTTTHAITTTPTFIRRRKTSTLLYSLISYTVPTVFTPVTKLLSLYDIYYQTHTTEPTSVYIKEKDTSSEVTATYFNSLIDTFQKRFPRHNQYDVNISNIRGLFQSYPTDQAHYIGAIHRLLFCCNFELLWWYPYTFPEKIHTLLQTFTHANYLLHFQSYFPSNFPSILDFPIHEISSFISHIRDNFQDLTSSFYKIVPDRPEITFYSLLSWCLKLKLANFIIHPPLSTHMMEIHTHIMSNNFTLRSFLSYYSKHYNDLSRSLLPLRLF